MITLSDNPADAHAHLYNMERLNVSLLITALVFIPKTLQRVKMELEGNVCGFEQKCAGNQTNLERKNSSCCLYCGCTDVCLERNNCCFDKPGQSKARFYKRQQCLPAVHKPNNVSEDVSADYYYTRNFCPDNFKVLSIKNRCETTVPGSFEEIRPVSSEDGEKVYKNEFCALCHGENNIIPWEIVIPGNKECNVVDTKHTKNIEKWTRFVILHCILLFKRPSKLNVRSVLCFDTTKVISECNMTGEWDFYNKEYETLCHNETMSNYVAHPRGLTYNNPYCYLCNKKANIASCHNFFESGLSSSRYLALINFDNWIPKPGSISDKNVGLCKNDELLDTFFGRCRRLFCPKYTLPIHGKCITIINFGQCTTLLVKLVLESYVNQTKTVINVFRSNRTKLQLQKSLGFSECTVCSTKVYQKNETDIYIGLCLQETTKCYNEYIWTKIFDVKTRGRFHFSYKLNRKRGTFQMEGTNENFAPSKFKLLHRPPGLISQCRASDDEHQLLCSQVELTKAEYETVRRMHVNAEKLICTPGGEGSNETTYICCNNYIISIQSLGNQTKASHGLMASLFLLRFIYD